MAIASVAGVGKEHIEVSVTAGSAVVEATMRFGNPLGATWGLATLFEGAISSALWKIESDGLRRKPLRSRNHLEAAISFHFV
jgi:hypothetical protein